MMTGKKHGFNFGWKSLLMVTLIMPILAISAEPNKQEDTTKRSDVRVLIDISGSMKKNDPNNLRIPALKIITNLLPKGADSGVWAFGKFVNMLVPLGTVDSKWQEKANASADKINSAGLFTNIGDAIKRSTWDWKRVDDTEKRSMILLTDGMVDISKDPAENEKERRRIFDELLPQLKQAGVTIHTIALSKDADSELLAALANQTDGWYREAEDANDLQKIFLKIFEQATPRDSLPLTDNQFKVDSSIDEMTILVFRESDSNNAVLYSPSDKTFDKTIQKPGVRWFATSGYDLITIENPEVGDWRIDASIDPDNRVLIVSKLGLAVDELPNNVLANEQINYGVKVLEDGKVITKEDFLSLIDAKLSLSYNGDSRNTPLIVDSGKGFFQQTFFAGKDDGVLNIKLTFKSPTFERSRTHAVNIYGSPVMANVELASEDGEPHKVHFQIAEDVVDINQLKVTAELRFPDDTKMYKILSDWTSQQVIELKRFPEGGLYQIDIQADGKTLSGRDFSSQLDTIEFQVNMDEAEPEPVKEEVKTEPVEEVVEKQEPEVVVEPEKEEPKEEVIEEPVEEEAEEPKEEVTGEEAIEPVNWTLWITLGMGGNVLLVGAGYFVWRLMKKKNAENVSNLTQELIDEDYDDDIDEFADDELDSDDEEKEP